jgi:WD40 repeat protein
MHNEKAIDRIRFVDVVAAVVLLFLLHGKGIAKEIRFGKPSKLLGHTAPVTVMAFSPDGMKLVSGSENGEVLVWDLSDLKPRRLVEKGPAVYGLAHLSDDRIAIAGKGKDILIVELGTGRVFHRIPHDQGTVAVLAADSKQQVLASGGYNGEIALWKTAKWQKSESLRGHAMRVTDLAFSPDGSLLVSGGITETEFNRTTADNIRIWKVANGKLVHALSGYGNRVTFTADGKHVVAASLRLWSNPNAPKNFVTRTKDGSEFIVDGGQFTTFWSCESGKKVAQIEGLGIGIASISNGTFFLAELGRPHHWDGWLYDAARNAKEWGKTKHWPIQVGGKEMIVIQRDAFDALVACAPVGDRFATLANDGWRQNAILLVDYEVKK